MNTSCLIVVACTNKPPDLMFFVDEAFVRKELSENFCFYNPKFDSINGATDWARKTLADHEKDKREYTYSREELEEEMKREEDEERLEQVDFIFIRLSDLVV